MATNTNKKVTDVYVSIDWQNGDVITRQKIKNIDNAAHETTAELKAAQSRTSTGDSAPVSGSLGERLNDMIIASANSSDTTDETMLWIDTDTQDYTIPVQSDFDHLVMMQDQQPSTTVYPDAANKIWVKSTTEQVEIPTSDELEQLQNTIASEYSTSKTYTIGDYVYYNGQLYRCINAVTAAGAWNASYWDEVVLADDVSELNSDLNYYYHYQATLINGDDANTCLKPGYYIKPASITVANLPSQNSGYLITLVRGQDNQPNACKQFYLSSSDLYCRTSINNNWFKINLDLSPYFYCSLTTLMEEDNFNDIALPGLYAKPIAISPENQPIQKAGYLINFRATNNTKVQLYITTQGEILYRGNAAGVWREAVSNHLYGKTLIGLGDSLMYGQGLSDSDRASSIWMAFLQKDYNMTVYNYGVSGSAIAYTENESPASMVTRIDTIITSHGNDTIDYFILEGGANDYGINTPLGVLSWENTDITTFYGALNSIINKVKNTWPQIKILLMTNYDRKIRSKQVDGTIINDEYYVNAMLNYAHFRGIPIFDNYHELGVSIRETNTPKPDSSYNEHWFFNITTSQHLSLEAHKYVLPIYTQKLLSI